MAEAAAKEPSMEDILSSIRKIIAEEGDTVSSTGGAARESASGISDTASSNNASGRDEAPASGPTSAAEAEDFGAAIDIEPPRNSDEDENAFKPSSKPHLPVERFSKSKQDETPDSSGMSLADIAASLKAAQPEEEEIEPEKSFDSSDAPEAVAAPVNRIEMSEATPPPDTAPDAGAKEEVPEKASQPALAGPAVSAASEEMQREEAAFRGALMSPSADNAVSGSFDRLKRSAMDDIEAKTEAILRPMLREWLDENLPTLVEKLVREEIERVARG